MNESQRRTGERYLFARKTPGSSETMGGQRSGRCPDLSAEPTPAAWQIPVFAGGVPSVRESGK